MVKTYLYLIIVRISGKFFSLKKEIFSKTLSLYYLRESKKQTPWATVSYSTKNNRRYTCMGHIVQEGGWSTVAGILVDLGHPQSRSSKSILNWGSMSVPTFQTFFGTASEGVTENQCCQLF
jgi:hypothetical protein